jgi:hypothetical protein
MSTTFLKNVSSVMNGSAIKRVPGSRNLHIALAICKKYVIPP